MLPDMGQLVDDERAQMQRRGREILAPRRVRRVEPDMAIRGHDDARRLENPPFSAVEADEARVDRVAEHVGDQRDLAGCWGAAKLYRHSVPPPLEGEVNDDVRAPHPGPNARSHSLVQ